ncbi:MAG: hypothetical protein ACYDDI_02330 [Candidatus Acidiferrales bacterium]
MNSPPVIAEQFSGVPARILNRIIRIYGDWLGGISDDRAKKCPYPLSRNDSEHFTRGAKIYFHLFASRLIPSKHFRV